MRTIICIILLAHSCLFFAQSIERQVIANSGGSYTNNINVDWTIGEPVTTFLEVNVLLSQGFQQYTASDVPLPLQLLSFSASRINESKVQLFWKIADAENILKYEIQRLSDNDNTFHNVGMVTHQQDLEDYRTYDPNSSYSESYYRLKIYEEDMTFTYSPVRSVVGIKPKSLVSVYPNPTEGILNIKVDVTDNNFPSQAFCYIYNNQGKRVVEQRIDKALQSLNLSQFPAGIYQLQLITASAIYEPQTFILSKE